MLVTQRHSTGRDCGVHGLGLGLLGAEVVGPRVHVRSVQPSRVQHEGIEASRMSVSVA